jgi:tetratricopeptide (TPR) repeat protein
MNSITRLILRRVISGNVALTPHVLKVLKECDQEQPEAGPLKNSENNPATPPEPSAGETPAGEKHLTFVNPLPGRWIRRTECALGAALLMAANLAHAAFKPSTWEMANNAFAQGKYAEAACGYESIIAQQGYSAPVLFNLANAQQRNRQPGQAILNYERAALLSPNDPDIAANLNSARQKAGFEPEPESPMQRAPRALTMNTWFGLAAAAVFMITVALPLKLLCPQARVRLNFGSAMAAFAFLVAVSALGLRGTDLRRAVVTAPEAVAGVSPVTMAQPVFKLRAGEVVTQQQTHGDFALVRNHAGHEGWIKTEEIARIIPAPATLPGS